MAALYLLARLASKSISSKKISNFFFKRNLLPNYQAILGRKNHKQVAGGAALENFALSYGYS
jgi:hypothetical protein